MSQLMARLGQLLEESGGNVIIEALDDEEDDLRSIIALTAFVGFSITQTLGFGSPQTTLKDNKSNGPRQN
jgi:hypothetical protein